MQATNQSQKTGASYATWNWEPMMLQGHTGPTGSWCPCWIITVLNMGNKLERGTKYGLWPRQRQNVVLSFRFLAWWRRWGTLCDLAFLWGVWWSSGWRTGGLEPRWEVPSLRRLPESERRALDRSRAAAETRSERRGLSAGPPRCWSPQTHGLPRPHMSSEPAQYTARRSTPALLERDKREKEYRFKQLQERSWPAGASCSLNL